MKKIISFKKSIKFPTMIGEITAISLEHNLKTIDESNIAGEFIITGNYKLTEASRIEEPFTYQIPAEIILTEQLELDTIKIDIDDFYYEIEEEDNLICNIDVLVEGVEKVELEEEILEEPLLEKIEEVKIEPEVETQEELVRECDGDIKVEEIINEKEKEKMIEEPVIETKEETNVSSLFSSLSNDDETFTTYSVIILQQEETITSLIEKYHTTKEDLENYNDLKNMTIGSKIIIPVSNE